MHADERLPREDLVALKKIHAEVKPSEVQIVLGLLVNARSFTMSLANDKHDLWTEQTNSILRKKHASNVDLASLLGRLNHTSFATPLARHFAGRISRLCLAHDYSKRINMTKEAISDLSL